MKSRLIALFLYGLIFNAEAASWVFIGHPANLSFVAFYESESVMKKGDTVTVWTRWVYEEPTKAKGRAVVMQVRHHCKDRTSDVLSTVIYDDDCGVIASSSGSNAVTSGDAIIPGSFGDNVYQLVCKPGFPTLGPDDVAFPNAEEISKRLFQSDYWHDLKTKKK